MDEVDSGFPRDIHKSNTGPGLVRGSEHDNTNGRNDSENFHDYFSESETSSSNVTEPNADNHEHGAGPPKGGQHYTTRNAGQQQSPIVTLVGQGFSQIRPLSIVKLLSSVLLCTALFTAACKRSSDLPTVGSGRYRELCMAFYLGLAALQSGEDVNARKGLTRATEVAAGEPAGWADLGLLQFRQQDYDGAYESIEKAHALVPENSRMEALLGVIESRRGKVDETLAHFAKAIALDPGNLKASYGLAQEIERQNSATTDAKAQQLLEQILQARPNNIAVLIDVVRLSAKRNDTDALKRAVAGLARSAPEWPEAAEQQFSVLEQQANSGKVHDAAIQAQFLRNVLVRVPAYRQSLDEVKTPVTSAGEPFLRFLKLPSPSSEPSALDTTLHFDPKPVAHGLTGGLTWIGTFVPNDKSDAEVIWADDETLHLKNGVQLPLPKTKSATGTLLPENAILAADLNYDFKTDFVIATGGGLRFYQQQSPEKFNDVTAKTNLPVPIVQGSYTGAWAFDVDLDGDLDVVLGVPEGEPIVLRNNGDGSYAVIRPFKSVDGLTDFTSADVDGDGDPDVALLDKQGYLKVFANERLGDYTMRSTPVQLSGQMLRLAAADVNGDGLPDFVILQSDFRVMGLSDHAAGRDWTVVELARAKPPAGISAPPSLTVADLDNNGALDLIVNDQVFLSDGQSFTALANRLPGTGRGFIEAKGRLNVIGLLADGHALAGINRAAKQYHWQDVRPRAATTNGDQRVNSFGIGGEIELRSELLTQKQVIESPILHFGLGTHSGAEFARIVWPNGLIQTEFALKANQTVMAEQRLKGSCPLLFTWNGHGMQFVKDVAPMSAALGAHDASGHFAGIYQTQEWFKINGEQLKSRDGFYDVRVTDEYWETYYIDHYSLLAVDHPPGTEIFADERVAVPAAPLKIYMTNAPHAFLSARDERGRDVSAAVRDLDGKYLDTFELGSYQGIARDHWVELELPPDAPQRGALYLIGQGWLRPWDDGNLVAASQGAQTKPRDLSLEIPDRQGHWIGVRRNLGVPAGREKTVVLDLRGLFQRGATRRLRLRTNLEIYWDKLGWAIGASDDSRKTQMMPLEEADLGHRGFSHVSQNKTLAPELPDYNNLSESGNKWPSLEGYYTRYGDVRPLLEKVDGRFVIATSGDELRLRFRAAPPPLNGWSRDFIFVGDGWMKEGDYSFKYSKTVLPLPYHSLREYAGPAKTLEDDQVYRLHKSDWQDFHTRYLAPVSLSTELRRLTGAR